MNYKLFNLLLSLCLSLTITALSQHRTDDELADIVRLGMAKRQPVQFKAEAAKETLRLAIEGLSDSEKIRGFFQIIRDDDETPRFRMSSRVARYEYSALAKDPDLIADYSELKKMLREEQDPRRFYLLSRMSPWTTEENKHNFIPELAHMLFEDGPVVKYEGEYTRGYNHDVSVYAYQRIELILKAHGKMFQSPQGLTHEQEAFALAKWLKGNWKGCEDLVIPEKFLQLELQLPESKRIIRPSKVKSEHDDMDSKPDPSDVKESSAEVVSNLSPDANTLSSTWLLVGCSVVVLSLLALVLKKRM